MLKFKYTLWLLCALPIVAMAQKNVPGYMGKRWNVGYHGYLFPSFHNPNSGDLHFDDSYEEELDMKTSLNYQHHLIAAYSISKRIDLLADLSFTSTNFDPIGTSVYEIKTANLSYPEMTAMGASLGIRIYSNHFAPLGSFVAFKVGYAQVKAEDFTYTTFEDSTYTTMGGTKGAPTMSIGWGVNRVIADKFFISYGLDFTLFTGGFGYWNTYLRSENPDMIFANGGDTRSSQKHYMKEAAARYAVHSMVNIKFGVGILL